MSGPGRERRWWRWTLAGVVLLAVIVVGGAAIFVKSQPSVVPLTLPVGRRQAAGRAGRWHLGRGRGICSASLAAAPHPGPRGGCPNRDWPPIQPQAPAASSRATCGAPAARSAAHSPGRLPAHWYLSGSK